MKSRCEEVFGHISAISPRTSIEGSGFCSYYWGYDPIHNFATHFLCSKVMEFLPKIRGGGVDINSIKLLHFLRFLNNIFF